MRSIGSVFRKAGLTPRLTGLRVFLHQYRKDGGTMDELLREARIEFELPDEGHIQIAATRGHQYKANARQPNGDDKAAWFAPQEMAAHTVPTSSPPIRGGKGQSGIAVNGGHRAHVIPVREPSASRIEAKRAAKTVSAAVVHLTVSQRKKFMDGRYVMQVRLRELPFYAQQSAVDAAIAKKLYERNLNQPDQELTVGQVEQNLDVLDEIVLAAERENRYVAG